MVCRNLWDKIYSGPIYKIVWRPLRENISIYVKSDVLKMEEFCEVCCGK